MCGWGWSGSPIPTPRPNFKKGVPPVLLPTCFCVIGNAGQKEFLGESSNPFYHTKYKLNNYNYGNNMYDRSHRWLEETNNTTEDHCYYTVYSA